MEGFEQLEARLRSPESLPAPYVVLTFDDGHESALRAADLLEERSCQATFYVTRDRSRNEAGFIREPEIRELRKRGFSLGTHGTTHRGLMFMSEGCCVDELEASKRWLEGVIGEEVRYVAAPGGFINGRVLELTHQQGYVLTATGNEWMNSPETMTVPGAVNRVNVRRQFSMQVLRSIVEGRLSFYLWRQVRAAALFVPKQMSCR